MIKLLSAIGRATIILAALLTIVGFAVSGYGLATSGYYGDFAPEAARGAGGTWGAVLGGVVGIIVAGAVFGPIATLYDIRDNIRRMAWPKA
jgi:MFS family permease